MQALHDLNQEFRERYAHQFGHRGPRQVLRIGRPHAARRARGGRFLQRAAARARSIRHRRQQETDDFGRQLLLARRLAERGVRFIQVCHAGGGNGGWDAHGDIRTPRPALPGDRQADRRPDPRSEAARHARRNARRLDQRVRPQPVVAEHHRPRPQPARLHRPGWPAAASRAASSTARPMTSATTPSRIATTTATCTPRSSTSSASIRSKWRSRSRLDAPAAGGRRRWSHQGNPELGAGNSLKASWAGRLMRRPR